MLVLKQYSNDESYDVLKNVEDPSLNDSELIQKLKYYTENCVPNKFKTALRLLKDSILPQKAIIWTIFVQTQLN